MPSHYYNPMQNILPDLRPTSGVPLQQEMQGVGAIDMLRGNSSSPQPTPMQGAPGVDLHVARPFDRAGEDAMDMSGVGAIDPLGNRQLEQPGMMQEQAPAVGGSESCASPEQFQAVVQAAADKGELEDGQGGFNWKGLLTALAPLMGAGVGAGIGALAGGKSGARRGVELGLSAGTGFGQGALQAQRMNEQRDFRQQQMDLQRQVAEGRMEESEARTRLTNLQLATLEGETQDWRDWKTMVSSGKADPTALADFARNSKDPRVRAWASAFDAQNAAATATAQDAATAGNPKRVSELVKQYGADVMDGKKLGHLAIKELRDTMAGEGLTMLPSRWGALEATWQAADMGIDVNSLGEESKKNLTGGYAMIRAIDQIKGLLTDEDLAKELGRLTSTGAKWQEFFTGTVPNEKVRRFRDAMRILTEDFGRIQTGAAITEDELALFQEITGGGLNLSVEDIKGRLAALQGSLRNKISAIVETQITGRRGWLALEEAERDNILQTAQAQYVPIEAELSAQDALAQMSDAQLRMIESRGNAPGVTLGEAENIAAQLSTSSTPQSLDQQIAAEKTRMNDQVGQILTRASALGMNSFAGVEQAAREMGITGNHPVLMEARRQIRLRNSGQF